MTTFKPINSSMNDYMHKLPNGTPGNIITIAPDGDAVDSGYQPGGGGAVPDATTTSKGIVQLAGDLAGTANAPKISVPLTTDTYNTSRLLGMNPYFGVAPMTLGYVVYRKNNTPYCTFSAVSTAYGSDVSLKVDASENVTFHIFASVFEQMNGDTAGVTNSAYYTRTQGSGASAINLLGGLDHPTPEKFPIFVGKAIIDVFGNIGSLEQYYSRVVFFSLDSGGGPKAFYVYTMA